MTKLDVDLNRYFSSLLNTLEVSKFLWQKKYIAQITISQKKVFLDIENLF